MSFDARSLLFLLALVLAPGAYALGLALGGDLLGAGLALGLIAAAIVYEHAGRRQPRERTEATFAARAPRVEPIEPQRAEVPVRVQGVAEALHESVRPAPGGGHAPQEADQARPA